MISKREIKELLEGTGKRCEVLSQEEIDNLILSVNEQYTDEDKEKIRQYWANQRERLERPRRYGEVLTHDEIDQLLTAINAGMDTDPEDFRPACDTKKIKIYDFKRPDKFSKEQIRTVSIMHETFARLCTTHLSTMLRSMVHVHVASVDQLTYEEFIRSIPTPTTLAIINMDPLHGNCILEIDPAITFSIIDRLAGGTGEGTKYQHELTEIESSIMEGVIVRMLGNLREAWTQVIDLRPRLGQIDTNPQFAQIVPPNEMTVLVTFEAKCGDVEGMINFCIPYLTIEMIMEKLTATYWYGAMNRRLCKPINADISKVDVNVIYELFRTEMSIKEIDNIKRGQVIMGKEFNRLRVNDTTIGRFKFENNEIEIISLSKQENLMEKNNVDYELGGTENVKVKIICELGRTVQTIEQVQNFREGTILALDKLAGEPVDLFANNVLIAKGEVVVIDENFGIRITDSLKDPLVCEDRTEE